MQEPSTSSETLPASPRAYRDFMNCSWDLEIRQKFRHFWDHGGVYERASEFMENYN
jgi:hypothetical protein